MRQDHITARRTALTVAAADPRVYLVAGKFPQSRYDGGNEFADLTPVILAGTTVTSRPSGEALHHHHNWSEKEDNLIDQVKEASHVLGTAADEKRHECGMPERRWFLLPSSNGLAVVETAGLV
jgi:hypothetical protein